MRLLWVPLLLAPAGVVFVATRTTIDPIAGAERLDVVPHLPTTMVLPTAAIGITTPTRHVTIRLHTHPRAAKKPKARARIARTPKPVYVVPKRGISHVTGSVTSHVSQTPKPKPKAKAEAKAAPAPSAAPAATTSSEPTPPPAQPPAPPEQPTPTPATPPAPAPTPATPPPAPRDGDGDDENEGEDTNGDTRPGNGWGDKNHEHTGPPGHNGKNH